MPRNRQEGRQKEKGSKQFILSALNPCPSGRCDDKGLERQLGGRGIVIRQDLVLGEVVCSVHI